MSTKTAILLAAGLPFAALARGDRRAHAPDPAPATALADRTRPQLVGGDL